MNAASNLLNFYTKAQSKEKTKIISPKSFKTYTDLDKPLCYKYNFKNTRVLYALLKNNNNSNIQYNNSLTGTQLKYL